MRGRDEAAIAAGAMRCRTTRLATLKQLQDALHAMPLRLEVHSVPKDKMTRNEYCPNSFRWLAKKAEGIWIVRLAQSNAVDRCVVVDATSGFIIDSVEEYPITLTEDTLRMCGGDDADNLHVAEARRIVVQRQKKRKH